MSRRRIIGIAVGLPLGLFVGYLAAVALRLMFAPITLLFGDATGSDRQV